MFKSFIAGVVLLSSVAAGAVPKVNAQLLISSYASQGAGFTEDIPPAQGSKHLKDFVKLVVVAKQHGVDVAVDSDMSSMGLWGLYSEKAHVIVLNPELDNDGAFATLAHELGHAFTYPLITGVEGDVVAQAVSFIICTRVGVDTTTATYEYYNHLASRDTVLTTLMRDASTIDNVSNFIFNEMSQVK